MFRIWISSVKKITLTIWFCLAFSLIAFSAEMSIDADPSTATVGMAARIEELILPGSELEVKDFKEGDPVVLRIVSINPHGPDMFRYELEYYGLKPGNYNLVNFLERIDHTSLGEVPEIKVQIKSILAAGRVEPNNPTTAHIPPLGGYLFWMRILAVLWIIGIFVILFAKRKDHNKNEDTDLPVPTLADRLQPMVEKAISGKLSNAQMAELEMMLVAFWRKRLHLEQKDIAQVTQELKNHEDAGPLLQQLEILLHRPHTEDEVNIAKILEPYQNLPAEALGEELATLAS